MADARPGDGSADNLKRYWLTKGLSRWATKPHPWTTLSRLLLEKTGNPELSKRLATELYHSHFGDYPGSDTARVRKGKPPRGERVGPG